MSANNTFMQASSELENAYALLSTLELPASGSMGELIQSQAMIQAQHYEIEQCANTLVKAQQRQLQMQHQFKSAMIEYEKFNYLEIQETQAHSAKIKKEEAKMLDEIGVMTYKREPL